MENVNRDDKFTINYKNNNMTFIGLKEALKEYNEENINIIMSNIIFILEKQAVNENMSKEDYFKVWKSQYNLLNEDYGFATKENEIIFHLTNAYFYRFNEELIAILKTYINNILNDKNDDLNKIEYLKNLTELTDNDIYKDIHAEQNLANLLVIISNKYGTRYLDLTDSAIENTD
jgi:hypothetical protein